MNITDVIYTQIMRTFLRRSLLLLLRRAAERPLDVRPQLARRVAHAAHRRLEPLLRVGGDAPRRRLNIGDGQTIEIETAYGTIVARAWVHGGIRPDSIFVPIGWDESQPYHPWQPVNFLTDETQRDPLSDHANLKTYMCRVSAKSA